MGGSERVGRENGGNEMDSSERDSTKKESSRDRESAASQGHDFHILGLTDLRVSELRDPFAVMGSRGTLLTIDGDEGVGAYCSAFKEASRTIERRNSDAILAYNGSGLVGVVGSLLSLRYDVPLLIRLNGDVVRQHREKALSQVRRREWRSLVPHLGFAAVTRLAFEYADGFVPVSTALEDVVRRQTGCSAARIASVPNPIRPNEYRASSDRTESGAEGDPGESNTSSDRGKTEAASDSNEDGRHILLTVTNLNFRGKYEGVTEVVDELVALLRRRPDLEYVVAGDGRYLDQLEAFVDRRVADESVRNRIRTPGFVEDVADLYAAATVFVYRSYIDGYPNVILEAQAAELPIVTNPAYGIDEQIEDGDSGRLVNPDDEGALADAVSTLLDDPDERARLARNARRRVEGENDPDQIGRELYDAVRSILSADADFGEPETTASSRGHPSGSVPGDGRWDQR